MIATIDTMQIEQKEKIERNKERERGRDDRYRQKEKENTEKEKQEIETDKRTEVYTSSGRQTKRATQTPWGNAGADDGE